MAGEAGDFQVRLTRKPRYIDEDKCTGCGLCMEYCPVEYPDPFNQEISNNKAVHIYFAQAIPLVAFIDESCRRLQEKKCRICELACKNGAINLQQKETRLEVNVGAVVLSPGYEPYDPRAAGIYGYGRYRNVVTSLDYERLLCATGPYDGRVLRTSDQRRPRKIAWIQCVGSRSVAPGENSYCSAVCCAYTQKQVILTKEHDDRTECTVFHNDIRAYGKDFELYYEKAARLPGVRFIRSLAVVVGETPDSQNVAVRYSTPGDGVNEEEFDLVVLSVGLNPPADNKDLAAKFGIDLTAHGFCRTAPADPMSTTRPGIYVSGAFQGPMDIPESVFSASGAGARCGELLRYRRGKFTRDRIHPQERDAGEEQPRIGVFVCQCGANIGRVVDVPSAVEYALTLPDVVHAQEQLFSCAVNSAQEITDTIKERNLNRVVVAACSPRTLEPLFRDTLREAGLNQYFCEMANIREHCSWVHSKEPAKATPKAKDLIRMAVARARYLEPLREIALPVDKKALVVGGGLAGMTCALAIARQGHEVFLVEKEADLGGLAARIHHTLDGLDVQAVVRGLRRDVYQHPAIHVHTRAAVTDAAGYIGNFQTRVESDRGVTSLNHGATVIASGAEVYAPAEYLYGKDDRVLTHLELEERLAAGDEKVVDARTLVMIQCVGCRNEDRYYCSRVCCGESVKNALKLKEVNPGMEVYILYRDVRTYGLLEDYYREAAERDVRFIRYEPGAGPRVEAVETGGRPVLRVAVTDPVLGAELALDADIIALAAAVVPPEGNRDLARLFKVPLGPDGFFKEAQVKLRPVEFAADGVFLCGMAHYPKHIPETINQACGAAGRVLNLLSRDFVTVSGSVCQVDGKKCLGCGACVSACAYEAVSLRPTRQGPKAEVNPVLCQGDGLCNAACPTGAINLKHFTDREILSQIDAAGAKEDIWPHLDAAVGH